MCAPRGAHKPTGGRDGHHTEYTQAGRCSGTRAGSAGGRPGPWNGGCGKAGRGGALYTVRIPIGSPMKPIVKLVRSTTWQGFESFTAQKCGQYGVLLLGIDKDTGAGYLYAVGHANGTSTVIKGLGKVSGTFNDPVYFRWGVIPVLDPIFGE